MAGLPETGASQKTAPVGSTMAAIARDSSGAIVERSSQVVPCGEPGERVADDGLDGGGVREHREDDVGLAGELGGRVGDAEPLRRELLGPGAGAVPADHVVPGGEEAADDAGAHRAEPCEAK